MDISNAIKAKSDQLNASDLMGGPIVVRIDGAKRGNQDQPVIVEISGGHMPWKPSKTALRALAYFLGTDTTAWSGRWIRLYRDARTLWAGKPVGGVMLSGIDSITKAETLTLAYSRGKTNTHRVEPIKGEESGDATASLHDFLDQSGISMGQLDTWCDSISKPPASGMDKAGQSTVAVYLAKNPDAVAAVKAIGGAE
jgi:hypothetical protein